MPHHRVRWRAFWLGFCGTALLIVADVPGASAAKIKMVWVFAVVARALRWQTRLTARIGT